jgi:Ca2+/Na+ antiporter
MNIAIKAALVGVVLNILLPLIFTSLATPQEIKPQHGAANLSYKGQFIHMMVHHNQVMVTSSVIIALIVYLSVIIAKSISL